MSEIHRYIKPFFVPAREIGKPGASHIKNYVSRREQGQIRQNNILDQIHNLSEKALFTILYDGRSSVLTATPEGYIYKKVESVEKIRRIKKIGYFGPHPSDLVDFLGGTVGLLEGNVQEWLVTEGEMGAYPLSAVETKFVRRQESKKSTDMQGVALRYLRNATGNLLPDGQLLMHIEKLTALIEENICAINFDVIFAPAPEIDHPDHVAVHWATLHALANLKQKGFYADKPLPALYITDPEFGHASGNSWARRMAHTFLPDIYPAIVYANEEYPYPFVTPSFIVDISKTIESATDALVAHQTQMKDQNGQSKEYVQKIPALKRIRGQQIGKGWGEGLRQYVIPGVTSEINHLASLLPQGSMYQLVMR